jgi:hypothetical protein
MGAQNPFLIEDESFRDEPGGSPERFCFPIRRRPRRDVYTFEDNEEFEERRVRGRFAGRARNPSHWIRDTKNYQRGRRF